MIPNGVIHLDARAVWCCRLVIYSLLNKLIQYLGEIDQGYTDKKTQFPSTTASCWALTLHFTSQRHLQCGGRLENMNISTCDVCHYALSKNCKRLTVKNIHRRISSTVRLSNTSNGWRTKMCKVQKLLPSWQLTLTIDNTLATIQKALTDSGISARWSRSSHAGPSRYKLLESRYTRQICRQIKVLKSRSTFHGKASEDDVE